MTEFEKALEVTQADRDAAAELALDRGLISAIDVPAMHAGLWDDWPVVQAFARHRIASLSTHKAAPVSDGAVERVALAITQEIGWGTFDHFDPGDVRRISAAALKASGLDEAIEALTDLEKFATAALAAVDKYNKENGTHLGGPVMFKLGRAVGRARTVADKLRSAS